MCLSPLFVDRSWPDGMGDPQEEAMTFGAWTMGQFEPFTYPGNLERVTQQAWSYQDAETEATEHSIFIRIRTSYILGNVDNNATVMPEDYDPIPEIIFNLKISRQLLYLPEAICHFNPGGECLVSGETIDELLERYDRTGLLPLEAIANIRIFTLPQNEEWVLMDTVGMGQLDEIDQEAIFRKDSYNANEVASFLRNVSSYILENGQIIKDGDTIDGPGDIHWQGATIEDGIASPPREVLRFMPMDRRGRPSGMQTKHKSR